MTDDTIGRRAVLAGAAGAAGLAAAGTGAAQSNGFDYGGWFDGVPNYDGTVDATGQDAVTVTVGASGEGGPLIFGPAAVHVDPGTTVTWEWSGEGGQHNVAADDDSFASELTGEAGFTYSQTFEEAGVVRYVCDPHEPAGMKGAVVVGDPATGGGGASTTDLLVAGSGVGLAGALLALFAAASRQKS
mgnify:CR=1 FL=1